MVGFGSRLREQFNSVRSGAAGPGSGASAGGTGAKNIRGLTRLGGGSDGGGGGAAAAAAAPLELPSSTPLGRSKVAVWGAQAGAASAEEPSAPSGHLASVKLGSTPPPSAAGTSPPRQPPGATSDPAPRSPSKPRWGDVDDDDDSDDGRMRGPASGQTTQEGGNDAPRGNSWRERPGESNSQYGTSPARYSDPDRGGGRFHDSYRGGGGGRYNSYNNDPDRGSGGRYNDQYRGEGRYNSSYHDHDRGGGGGRQYGDDRRGTHSDHFGSFGGGDRGQYRERGHRYDGYDRGYDNERGGRYGRDPYGTHDRQYGNAGGAAEPRQWRRGIQPDEAAAPVSERFGGGSGSYRERRSFDESGGGREAPSPRAAPSKKAEEPPRTLLRSNDAAPPAAPAKADAEGGAHRSAPAGEATRPPRAGASASAAGRLEKLGGTGAAARPPNPWTAQPTVAPAVMPARGEDASAPAVGILPPVAEQAPPPRTQEEIEKEKKDQAMKQQMSILQHVAERRARASSASSREGKKSSAAEEKEAASSPGRPAAATRTLERKKSADVAEDPEQRAERRKGAKAKAKSDWGSNPCRVEGHDHDWKDCPRNPKSEHFVARDKPPKAKKSKAKSDGGQHNPCRIEGHDHDWTDCPSNPKSGSFVRDNPCRIEGHDHDWSDCRDNPKSANYVKPSSRGKGKKSKGKKKASKGSVPEVPDTSDGAEKGAKEGVPEPRSEGGTAMEKSKAQPKEEPGAATPANGSEKPPPEEKKPFAPAPPPKVSAWVTGPPPAVTHVAPSLATPSRAPGLSSPLAPTPAHASSEAAAMTSQPLNTQMPQLDYGQQRQSVGIIQKPRPDALFSGNEALFGTSEGASAPIYDSWNPPPIVLPSAAVDHWEANPFAPKPARPPSSGPRFGSILNEGAVALVPSKSAGAGPAKDAKFFRG